MSPILTDLLDRALPRGSPLEVTEHVGIAAGRATCPPAPECQPWPQARHTTSPSLTGCVGDSRTEMTLMGRYQPPGGALGRRVDELLLHRLADATVRAFLTSLATSLCVGTEVSSAGL
jgi:hypothetical protein